MGLVLLTFGLIWVNYQFAFSSIGQGRYIIRHSASQALLRNGVNPYSEQLLEWFIKQDYQIANQIQDGQFKLKLPLYSLLLYMPLSFLKNPAVGQAVWMMLQEVMLIGLVVMIFDLLEWSPPFWVQGLLLLLALGFFHSVQAIAESGIVIVVSMFLVILLKSVKNEYDQISGVLLGLLMIAPSLSLGVVLFTLLWMGSKKRFRIVFSFLATFGILLVISLIIIPEWLINYFQVFIAGGVFTDGKMLIGKIALITPGIFVQMRLILALGLCSLLLSEWYSFRKADFDGYLWTVVVTLVISCFFVPLQDSTPYVVLLPGLMLVIRGIDARWVSGGVRYAAIILAFVLFIPWMIFIFTDQLTTFPLQKEIMYFVIPLISMISLYWIKWWLVLPNREIWNRIV